MVNYLKLDTFSLLCAEYVFVDTKDYLSCRLFSDAGIRIQRFRIMSKKNSPYRLIIAKIRKKSESQFVEVMEKLRNHALIMGYREYDEICETLKKCVTEKTG